MPRVTRKRFLRWFKKLVGRQAKPFSVKAPSKTKQGELILDHEDLTEMWCGFLEGKFKSTDAKKNDRHYDDIGAQIDEDPVTKEAFLKAVARLKNGKACGPDDIPGEVFKNCDAAPTTALFQLLCRMWEELEYVPEELVRAAFIMIYKNEDTDNPSNYRCIGLLPHSYKVLSIAHHARQNRERMQ